MAILGNTHLVSGTPQKLPLVLEFLRGEGIDTLENPDLYTRTYRHFGVEEARALRERASLRPLGDRRIFVVAASDINREAQNALLKTLEEPPANALFIFILPAPETLLPTFRSRAQFLVLGKTKGGSSEADAVDAREFLAAAQQERLDMLKPLLEKGEDDKRDLGKILAFLGGLERGLANTPGRRGLDSVYRARKYVTDKGALVKPLLEQVALLVPKI